MKNIDLIHAYRHLYRAALQAVRFSTPAKYQIRDIIRPSFRHEPAENFVPRRIENTKAFLRRAAEYNGIEHKILRNILHSSYWRGDASPLERYPPWMRRNDNIASTLRKSAYTHLDTTLTMLNESMDLCLRSYGVPASEQQERIQAKLRHQRMTRKPAPSAPPPVKGGLIRKVS